MPLINFALYSLIVLAVYVYFRKKVERPQRAKIIDLQIPEWVNSGPRDPVEELNILLADAVSHRLSRVRSLKRADYQDLAEEMVFIAMAYGDGRVRAETNNIY
jgi:hypothetical protein